MSKTTLISIVLGVVLTLSAGCVVVDMVGSLAGSLENHNTTLETALQSN